MLTRRTFLTATGASVVTVASCRGSGGMRPAVISTWAFGQRANATAWQALASGASALDAVEQGVNVVELDPENLSVGFGGLPDEEGEVTNDAIVFWGPRHTVGAVGCLKRLKRAISVARKVMEKTRHTLLVGEDATRFALKVGFKEEPAPLLTPGARARWEAWKADPKRATNWNHDTIGMVALDRAGDLCVGTSTSGLGFKIKGRVGDVPIPGAGAYVDNEVGGVAATGDGDVMMRFSLASFAVEQMRGGASPVEACIRALARIEAKGYRVPAALVALNKRGEFGAARIGEPPFSFAVKNASIDEVRNA
jgi:N4-(beta-N-acetylglucosaminyl)-L-asparaginase